MPDRVFQPGEHERDEAEADEFFADVLASAAVAGTVKMVNKRLERRTPPERAKPHPTTTRWAAEGLAYRLEQLMGHKALGPNAKIALGFGGIIVTMLMNAETIPAGERPAAPPPSHANGAGAAVRADVKPEAPAASSEPVPEARQLEGDPHKTAATGTFRREN